MNPYSNMGYPINTPVRPIQTTQNSYMNMSPQMQYQQPLPQPVQYNGLRGRYVTCADEVRAAMVDLDGVSNLFPCPAEQAVYTKFIDNNGNAVIQKYKLEQEPIPVAYADEKMFAQLDNRIKRIEDLISGVMCNANESHANDATNEPVKVQPEPNASNANDVRR